MKLRAIRDRILFAFLERRSRKGIFEESTQWGFTVTTQSDLNREGNKMLNRTTQRGRWAKALLVGPTCKEVKVGDYICVEPLMYTNAFEYDGIKINATDETKVMMISKEKPNVFI